RVFQALAGLELGLVGGRNLDLSAGGRVAADACLALGDREGAESDQTHLVPLLQGLGDGVENCVNGFAGLSLRHIRRVGNDADQIVLVHSVSSQWNARPRWRSKTAPPLVDSI